MFLQSSKVLSLLSTFFVLVLSFHRATASVNIIKIVVKSTKVILAVIKIIVD